MSRGIRITGIVGICNLVVAVLAVAGGYFQRSRYQNDPAVREAAIDLVEKQVIAEAEKDAPMPGFFGKVTVDRAKVDAAIREGLEKRFTYALVVGVIMLLLGLGLVLRIAPVRRPGVVLGCLFLLSAAINGAKILGGAADPNALGAVAMCAVVGLINTVGLAGGARRAEMDPRIPATAGADPRPVGRGYWGRRPRPAAPAPAGPENPERQA